MKKALILGSSGLIGMSLLSNLLQDPKYGEVIALVRKKQLIHHRKLTQIVIDFDQMAQYKSYFQVQDVFCCLGTTIKKAKTNEAFRKVDFTYPLQAAEISSEMDVQKFLLVTAIGASIHSRFFYNQVKGEVEREVGKQPIPAIFFFRPSLLLGERRELRIGEKLTSCFITPLSFLFVGPLRRYRPISAKIVADTMLLAAKSDARGLNIIESNMV